MSDKPEAKIIRLQEENELLRREILNLKQKSNPEFAEFADSDKEVVSYSSLNISEYISIFDSLPTGILLYDENMRVTAANSALYDILSIRGINIIGFDLHDLKDTRLIPVLEITKQGKKGFYEGEYRSTFSSTITHISLQTIPHLYVIKGELINGGIAVIEDISEKRIAEEAVNRTFDIFQTVTDNIESYIFVVQPETRKVIFMNSKARKLFGNINKMICSDEADQNIPEDCMNCVLTKAEFEQLKQGKSFRKEAKNNYFDQWFQYSYSLINWTEGEKAVLVTSVDIQNLKNALEQVSEQNTKINRQAERLKIESATKDTMFSIVGHDLRGPLGNIKNAMDILAEEYESLDSDEIKEFINSVRDSSGSAYSLLANLLNWAKNQSGKIVFCPEKLDIDDIVEENLMLLKANYDNKNIRLTYNNLYKKELYADENMLNTVFRNLISNAIKFTHRNGYVIISIEAEEREGTAYMKTEICDTGIGLSEESLVKVLQAREPRSEYGTENEKGSGLGLILCKAFIEKHKGIFEADSKLGSGTCFRFLLPENLKKEG